MKYRLTHDDGLTVEVAESVWEALLERAYRNGWRPSGTEPPRSRVVRCGEGAPEASRPQSARARTIVGPRWASSDYFSASSQYVSAEDARLLGCAALARTEASKATAEPGQESPEAILRVARFALHGGFEIGLALGPSTRKA